MRRMDERIFATAIAVGLAMAVLGQPSASSAPFSRQAPDVDRLVHEAKVICRRFQVGNVIRTLYCNDGYVCVANDKCAPGPALQRKLDEAAAAKRRAEEARAKEAAAQAKAIASAKQREAFSRFSYRFSQTQIVSTRRELRRSLEIAISTSQGGTAGWSPGHYQVLKDDPRNIPSPRYQQGRGAVPAPAPAGMPVSQDAVRGLGPLPGGGPSQGAPAVALAPLAQHLGVLALLFPPPAQADDGDIPTDISEIERELGKVGISGVSMPGAAKTFLISLWHGDRCGRLLEGCLERLNSMRDSCSRQRDAMPESSEQEKDRRARATSLCDAHWSAAGDYCERQRTSCYNSLK